VETGKPHDCIDNPQTDRAARFISKTAKKQSQRNPPFNFKYCSVPEG
jgi:hypothetical protein